MRGKATRSRQSQRGRRRSSVSHSIDFFRDKDKAACPHFSGDSGGGVIFEAWPISGIGEGERDRGSSGEEGGHLRVLKRPLGTS